MPVLGVTGGVATGKSTVARRISLRLGWTCRVESFSADEASRQLLESDEILHQLTLAFGDTIFQKPGQVNRGKLRDLIFHDPAKRLLLESILHPAIRRAWTERCEEFRGPGKYFVAEIPLLYETQAENRLDCVIVVAASRHRQTQRLCESRAWSLETASHAIDSQLPLEQKIHRADLLIWNDHTEELLDRQIQLACESLNIRYA